MELQTWLDMTMFPASNYLPLVHELADLAWETDRGIVLAEALAELLRRQRVILPTVDVIERVCGEAVTLGTRQEYEALTTALSDDHRLALDRLLAIREGTKGSGLIWLRQAEGNQKALDLLKRISPIAWQHIHFLGHYAFRDRKNPIDLEAILASVNFF